jgi:hypothetical protein
VASKGKGPSLVYIEPSSVKGLQEYARLLKGREGGAKLRKDLRRAIERETRPLVDDMKAEAEGLQFKGTASGQRASRTASLTKTGKVRKGTGLGLRQAMSRGIKTETSISTGNGAGVRIRLKSNDPDVNRLGRSLNSRGKVRHPTRTGPRFSQQGDKWADTVAADGKGWFYRPVDKHRPKVTAGVRRVIEDMVRQLSR